MVVARDKMVKSAALFFILFYQVIGSTGVAAIRHFSPSSLQTFGAATGKCHGARVGGASSA
jgi:hypothetical protein